ncbi:MAG: hypothetical protein LBE15_03920, partial [Burkholderiales bacterium]|nr:hypothetical protein [Burkholderiales bacterium]
GIRYHPVSVAASSKSATQSVSLRADDGVSEVLLRIDTPTARQQRGKSVRQALDRAALKALLESEVRD